MAKLGSVLSKRKFNPDGGGYDFETARAAGIKPDATGHWPSRDARTGMILKGRKHPTFNKTIAADQKLGYKMIKKGGRYYSLKRD